MGAFILAGYFLHGLHARGQELFGFTILFFGAFLCRLASIVFLLRHDEVKVWEDAAVFPTVRQGLRQFVRLKGLGILVFMLLMYLSANTAGPFFSPYMLKALKLTYEEYTFLIGGMFLGKIFFSPVGGLVLKHAGPQICLLVASLMIALTPRLWVFSQYLPYLFTLQVLSGCAWATFELASTLLIFEKVEPGQRIMALTFYTMIHSVVVVAGSTLGGAFLEFFGTNIENYWNLFSISTYLRLMAVAVLAAGMGKGDFGRKFWSWSQKKIPLGRSKARGQKACRVVVSWWKKLCGFAS